MFYRRSQNVASPNCPVLRHCESIRQLPYPLAMAFHPARASYCANSRPIPRLEPIISKAGSSATKPAVGDSDRVIARWQAAKTMAPHKTKERIRPTLKSTSARCVDARLPSRYIVATASEPIQRRLSLSTLRPTSDVFKSGHLRGQPTLLLSVCTLTTT